MMNLTRIIFTNSRILALSLILSVPALLPLVGCNDQMNMPQTRFLSQFRLDKSVKNTAYAGIDHSGPGGSIGAVTGGIGEHDTEAHHSSAREFIILEEEASRFDEQGFMEALKEEVRKEIEASGGSILASESEGGEGYRIEYKEGETRGKVTIRGARRGRHYNLRVDIEEEGKR